MATSNPRVDEALEQLLTRLLPSAHDHSDIKAQRHYAQTLDFARQHLDDSSRSSNVQQYDVSRVADLVSRRLSVAGPSDRATEFQRLYSRLSALPLPTQKGAILAFLHQLTTPESPSTLSQQPSSTRDRDRQAPPGPATSHDSHMLSPDMYSKTHTKGCSPLTRHTASRQAMNRAPASAGQDSEQSHAASGPTQETLLRDLPFILQGLSSSLMAFSDNDTLRLPADLPITVVSILHTLAEPALLYRRLHAFVESKAGDLTVQSLQSAVAGELKSYLGMIATLESQIRPALAPTHEQPSTKLRVTLKRCVVWTREATMALRLISTMVDGVRGKKGGEVISKVHSFATLHGDPFVQSFATRLLASVSRPFYTMLRRWISSGELQDPFEEFFVRKNPDPSAVDPDPRRTGGTSLWEKQYMLYEAMIPTIVDRSFASKVFLIGKSLNFIRETCGDAAWVDAYSSECAGLFCDDDENNTTLIASVDQAYAKTMAHLLELMESKFKLFDHLSALKKYLLLGQGDFISLLMESLAGNLDRSANSQYRHTLTAQLEHAIRNSNAQSESPEVLKRLDARMLELSHGEIGWDVFTLEYRIDSPLDVIVTPWASKQYLKIFNFLWRVKRVEFTLGQTFRNCMTGARGILRHVGPELADDWKMARAGMSAMVHFLCQLQYYILFEVIEAGWEGLQRDIRKPGATLDDLIEAHNRYLQSITRKGLLSSSSTSSQPSTHFTAQLHELLKLILSYKNAVEALRSVSIMHVTSRTTRPGQTGLADDHISSGNAAAGNADVEMTGDDTTTIEPLIPHVSGATTNDASTDPNTMSSAHAAANVDPNVTASAGGEGPVSSRERTRNRLMELERDFRVKVCVFLGDLAHQSESDMRFLGVVMNFNDAYRPVRRRTGGGSSVGGGGGGAGGGGGSRDRDRGRD